MARGYDRFTVGRMSDMSVFVLYMATQSLVPMCRSW